MANGVTIGTDALKSIVPLLTGGAPKQDDPPAMPPAPPMPPPGPPPPTPAQAGWQAFSADPQNQQRAAHAVTEPGQSIIPPTIAAPPAWGADSAPGAPPPDPVPSMGNIAPMTAPPPSMGAPMPNVTQAPSYQDQQAAWMKAHPEQVAKPLIGKGAGKLANVLQFAAAGLAGAGGGLNGNTGAGLDYVQRLNDYDRAIPETNNARFRAAVIQPREDQAKLEDTQSQTEQRNALANKANAQADQVGDPAKLKAKQIADAAKLGSVPTYDEKGNLTGYAPDEKSQVYQKNQAALALSGAHLDDTKAQKELRDAQTALAKAKNDPNSPAFKQAQARVNTAQANVGINAQKLALATKRFELQSMGTVNGVQPAGGMQDDNGNPIGTAFQGNVRPTGAERNKGDMARSAEKQLSDLADIVQKNRNMFGPGYGQTTEFKKWIGAQSPDAQRFLAARTIAGDHLAGTFGGRSEAALDALDKAIGQFKDNPDAALAGIKQLTEANSLFKDAGTVRTKGSKASGAQTPASQPSGGIQVGQTVKLKNGVSIKVTKVHPDGSFE